MQGNFRNGSNRLSCILYASNHKAHELHQKYKLRSNFRFKNDRHRYYYHHPQSQQLTLCRRHVMVHGDVGVESSQLLDSEDHGDVVKMTTISSQKS